MEKEIRELLELITEEQVEKLGYNNVAIMREFGCEPKLIMKNDIHSEVIKGKKEIIKKLKEIINYE